MGNSVRDGWGGSMDGLGRWEDWAGAGPWLGAGPLGGWAAAGTRQVSERWG